MRSFSLLSIRCSASIVKPTFCYTSSKLLSIHLPVPLLHGPDGDDEATADAEDSCQFPQRPHPALRRREVVDHGHGEDGVETVVPERQRQVIAQQHLQAGHRNTLQ